MSRRTLGPKAELRLDWLRMTSWSCCKLERVRMVVVLDVQNEKQHRPLSQSLYDRRGRATLSSPLLSPPPTPLDLQPPRFTCYSPPFSNPTVTTQPAPTSVLYASLRVGHSNPYLHCGSSNPRPCSHQLSTLYNGLNVGNSHFSNNFGYRRSCFCYCFCGSNCSHSSIIQGERVSE